jgi:hypothetical protein
MEVDVIGHKKSPSEQGITRWGFLLLPIAIPDTEGSHLARLLAKLFALVASV